MRSHLRRGEGCATSGENHQLYSLPTRRELSAVIIDPDINVDIESIRKKREIIIQSHGGALQNIPSDSPLYDPLSYTISLSIMGI